MGPRPPSSRGQDFDARTTGGGGRPLLRRGRMGGMRDGWILAAGDLCITVIPAPEPESRGGNLGLNLMSILPNMVSHQ